MVQVDGSCGREIIPWPSLLSPRSVRNWGKVHGHSYDQENGLLVGYAFNAARRGGNGDATETFKEDKDYGGVRMAPETAHPEGKGVVIFLMT